MIISKWTIIAIVLGILMWAAVFMVFMDWRITWACAACWIVGMALGSAIANENWNEEW